MPGRWELICHHTYSGIPGVVLDQSPGRWSHGRAIGLADGDFLADGLTPGSGSVRLYKVGARVHVPIAEDNQAAWRPLVGVKGEVSFRRDTHPSGAVPIDMLIDAGSFHICVRVNTLVAWFSGHPAQYAEITSAFDPVGSPAYQVPVGAWTTVGFLYDGLGTMELSAGGQVVARKSGVFAPLKAAGGIGVSIGNSLSGDAVLYGEIDEVKIWRLDPLRFANEFFSRPMDAQAADCWRRLARELEAAAARHPDCVREVLVRFRDALDRLQRQALAAGPETRQRLRQSQRAYRQLWRAGRIDSPEMRRLFADLITWMGLVGVRPEADPELIALRDSDCLRTILGELSVPDCDPQAVALLAAIIEHLGGSAAARHAGGLAEDDGTMARTDLATGQNATNLSSYTTASFTPHAHRVVLAFVMSVNQSTTAAAEPTVTGNGLDWVTVRSVACRANGDYRLTCFSAVGGSPSAGVLAIDFAGQAQACCAWSVFEYDLAGADAARAIVQSQVITSGAGNVSTSGVGLAPFRDPVKNTCVGGAIAAASLAPGALVQGVGLAQVHAQTIGGAKPGALDTQDRTGEDTSVDWSMTTAAPVCAIALEINTTLDAESLARRFEPILFFHPAEEFFPSDAKRYIEHGALWRTDFPIDQKDSWSGKGLPFDRKPLVARPGLSAGSAEPGTFLGTHVTHPPGEQRFIEVTGWKNKAGALEPEVKQASENTYAHRDGLATLYNAEDTAGGNAKLRDSRFWYHAEAFDPDRLRRLLATVRAPDLVKVLDSLANPALLCFYLFFPAHVESLAGPCTNVEAVEFAGFVGEWDCLAVLLERVDPGLPFTPSFIGYTGRPLPPAGVGQGGAERENMKVSPFAASDRNGDHPKLFVARGTHSLYLEAGPQGVHAVAASVNSTDCGRNENPGGPFGTIDFGEAMEGLVPMFLKMFLGGGIFPGLGMLAAYWWVSQEAPDFGADDDDIPGPVLDALAPDQGPAPGALGTVVHPVGLAISEPGGQLKPWTSVRDLQLDSRTYDFVVDRPRQVWWPGDTPTGGFSGGPGYRGLWGPPATGDPKGRRAGMTFPDFWRSFFLALADGKAKNIL